MLVDFLHDTRARGGRESRGLRSGVENYDPKTTHAQSTIRRPPHQILGLKPPKSFWGSFRLVDMGHSSFPDVK